MRFCFHTKSTGTKKKKSNHREIATNGNKSRAATIIVTNRLNKEKFELYRSFINIQAREGMPRQANKARPTTSPIKNNKYPVRDIGKGRGGKIITIIIPFSPASKLTFSRLLLNCRPLLVSTRNEPWQSQQGVDTGHPFQSRPRLFPLWNMTHLL